MLIDVVNKFHRWLSETAILIAIYSASTFIRGFFQKNAIYLALKNRSQCASGKRRNFGDQYNYIYRIVYQIEQDFILSWPQQMIVAAIFK